MGKEKKQQDIAVKTVIETDKGVLKLTIKPTKAFNSSKLEDRLVTAARISEALATQIAFWLIGPEAFDTKTPKKKSK